jgi:hypothetical protein
MRGISPATVDVPAGSHRVMLEAKEGSVHREVTVAAGETVEVVESIYAGFLAVFAPFELEITDSGAAIRLDDRNQVLMSPGTHKIRLQNRALEYTEVRDVEVTPGAVTRITIKPRSTITVTASEAADVWIDGARIGATPLEASPIDPGTHEVVLKRASGADRRFTVKVTAKPFTLNVDFTQS